jgi:hypothetical protein
MVEGDKIDDGRSADANALAFFDDVGPAGVVRNGLLFDDFHKLSA